MHKNVTFSYTPYTPIPMYPLWFVGCFLVQGRGQGSSHESHGSFPKVQGKGWRLNSARISGDSDVSEPRISFQFRVSFFSYWNSRKKKRKKPNWHCSEKKRIAWYMDKTISKKGHDLLCCSLTSLIHSETVTSQTTSHTKRHDRNNFIYTSPVSCIIRQFLSHVHIYGEK